MKNLCFLFGSFFKWKNCWHLEFLINQLFGQRFIIFKIYIWGMGVNYCWSYGLSKLLLHFVEYRLDQLNSKHIKIAVNSAIQYLDCSQKKCLLKVWRFLVHPPQNGGSVKFCETERKPSFNDQYFQTSRISDIWFNENS